MVGDGHYNKDECDAHCDAHFSGIKYQYCYAVCVCVSTSSIQWMAAKWAATRRRKQVRELIHTHTQHWAQWRRCSLPTTLATYTVQWHIYYSIAVVVVVVEFVALAQQAIEATLLLHIAYIPSKVKYIYNSQHLSGLIIIGN